MSKVTGLHTAVSKAGTRIYVYAFKGGPRVSTINAATKAEANAALAKLVASDRLKEQVDAVRPKPDLPISPVPQQRPRSPGHVLRTQADLIRNARAQECARAAERQFNKSVQTRLKTLHEAVVAAGLPIDSFEVCVDGSVGITIR